MVEIHKMWLNPWVYDYKKNEQMNERNKANKTIQNINFIGPFKQMLLINLILKTGLLERINILFFPHDQYLS